MIGWDDDDCPCDLVFSYEAEACVIPCIPFDQPQAQLYTIYTILICFSWLSFLCGWFYCITALFRKELRQFPLSTTATLQFILSFSSIGLIFTGNLGLPYTLCESDVELADQGKWTCWFIGIMGFIAAVGGIHAWTAFNVSIILTLAKVQQKGKNWARWLVVAWCVVPTVIAVAVLFGTDRIGATPSFFTCGARATRDQALRDPIIWIFWLGPLIFWLLFNLLLMGLILSYIFKSAFQAGIPLARLLKQQLRLFLFYLWFISGISLSVFNVIYGESNADQWISNVEEYLLCVNTNLLYGYLTPDDDSCSPCELGPTHLPFGLVLAQLLLNSTLGIVCFLLLGFRRDIFKWWLEYWVMAWKKKKFFVMKEMEEARSLSVRSESSSGEKLQPHIRVQSASSL